MRHTGRLTRMNFFKIYSKNITGYFYTRMPNTEVIKKGESVLVYEAPEWNEMEKFLNDNDYFSIIPKDSLSEQKMYDIWTECVLNTQFKSKYFGLLPFFVEDRQTIRAKKKFVLKMELYPETKHLKFTIPMISGVAERFEALEDIVPITPGDYRIRHILLRSRPPSFVDMDMVYGNRKAVDMYCFDKIGTWIKEVRLLLNVN